ncbi:PQQ-dependent sugar dehydrogenase [Shivajiella indica]|uniref:PQQ-dependent sugar dehydrogenase n=1 Tax=Shivajiella indica TaxID=872115 RepID=A0ABW5BBX4_9BACT
MRFPILPFFVLLLITGSCGKKNELFVNEKPEESRFTKITLIEKLDEPMEIEVLKDGRILFIERRGKIKIFEPQSGLAKDIGFIPVYSESEDGLLGLAKDPGFETNQWIYLYYSPQGELSVNRLSRFTLVDDILDMGSEKIMLEIPHFRGCCHSGGSIEFDSKGNLFLSLGDDTTPFESDNYNPIDERSGRPENVDAQRSSSNTNDLRGAILRITPQTDGTYTIPEGNLFPEGTPDTRPEIYVMGNRNPFRISVDPKNGYLYWGEVGPDAQFDSLQRGPRGYDEVNQAKEAGFFGWPYFIGDNKRYWDYDFQQQKSLFEFDPKAPVNNSPNNTGLKQLPPAHPAMIWYPYADSEDFPMLRSGGRNAMAGPVYYYDLFPDSEVKFPKYYHGKLFFYDWMRNWIFTANFDENGDFQSMEEFMPSTKFDKPIDMQFGPDGALYILEYGTYWSAQNDDSGIYKIEFSFGNRKPIAKAAADKTQGALPFTVRFNSEGSLDFDGDELIYEWDFYGDGTEISNGQNPSFVFKKEGEFQTVLTVKDKNGASNQTFIPIVVGNEPPKITIQWNGNRSFYWGNPRIKYKVGVEDKEDGNLSNGGIPSELVRVTWDFLQEGFDKVISSEGHQLNENSLQLIGQDLTVKSGCNACHGLENVSVGPSYKAVALKYEDRPDASDYLVKKVLNGGGGVWGERLMPSHAHIENTEITQIVDYILSLSPNSVLNSKNRIGLEGELNLNKHVDCGTYLFAASYTDKGANGIAPISRRTEITLRNPLILAADADFFKGTAKANNQDSRIIKFTENSSYIGFKDIDLNYLEKITLSIDPNRRKGWFEIREGSIEGTVIGKTPIISNESRSSNSKERWFEYSISLKKSDKVSDIYILFQTETGVDIWNSFLMNTIYFENKK